MGRPKNTISRDQAKPKAANMYFRVDSELYQKFCKIAAVQKLSTPRLARLAVEEYVQRNKQLLQLHDSIWDSSGKLKLNVPIEANYD